MSNSIGIIGLGYVGLPLAIEAAKSGFRVVGIDKDLQKIGLINNGNSGIEGIDENELSSLISSRKIDVTSEYSKLNAIEIIIVCVPTPLNKKHEPDLGYVIDAATKLSVYVKRGTLIIFESTVSPGTTREILAPLIQEKSKIGSEELLLAFSPERIDPANTTWNVKNTPKLVAGINGTAARMAAEFYSKFIDKVVTCDSLEIAETAKLLENSFRLLNIAFINELSNFCFRQGIDVLKVIAAASTKPYGFMPFYPGLGAGGHCIPVDPVYLTTRASEVHASMKLLELAQKVNSNTPVSYINRLESKVGKIKNKKILIVGIAYKANVADVRESPALTLIDELRAKKAVVKWHDEFVQHWNGENSVDLNTNYDFAILATFHNGVDLSKLNGIVVYDSRGSLI